VETETQIESVEKSETRGGNMRWVVRDADGREYTTFRPRIGEEAERFRGRRATLEYHEQERNGFHNVYLDAVKGAPEAPPAAGGDSDPDEVAWSTAVEAAPWLLGTSEPKEELAPDELYEKLEPFKRRVSEDIRRGGDDEDDDETG
jgi:hypothetical protein